MRTQDTPLRDTESGPGLVVVEIASRQAEIGQTSQNNPDALDTATTLRDTIIPPQERLTREARPRRRDPTLPRLISTREREKNRQPNWQHLNAYFGGNFTTDSVWLVKWQAHVLPI